MNAPAAGPGSKVRLRLWLALLGATRAVERELRERLEAEFSVTLPRFDVLAALYRDGAGLTMTEVSRRLRVSNGNVTGIVGRLVADGLVLRAPEQGDRRAVRVRLSARGRRAFERMAGAHEAWVDELLGAVGGEEAAALGATLARFPARREKGGSA